MRRADRLLEEVLAEDSFLNRFGSLELEDVDGDEQQSSNDLPDSPISTPRATIELDESEIELQFISTPNNVRRNQQSSEIHWMALESLWNWAGRAYDRGRCHKYGH